MNPQQTLSPQPQAGAPVQPQAATVSPQGVASQVPLQAPTPPQLPQAPTPVASPGAVATPNFNTAQQLQNIAAYYNIPRTAQAVAGAGQAQGAVAESQFEHQKAENEIDIQNNQNMLNPSTYQFSKNSDGTVTILNSLGDKVSIGQYAALTGANPAQALQTAGATDEADQKFIAAYNNLQTYAQAKIAAANGDEQAQQQIKDFNSQNPGLENLELGALQGLFMGSYGSYFGQPQNNEGIANTPGLNSTLTSANNPKSTSAYYGGFPTPTPISETASTINNPNTSDILSGLTIAPGQ